MLRRQVSYLVPVMCIAMPARFRASLAVCETVVSPCNQASHITSYHTASHRVIMHHITTSALMCSNVRYFVMRQRVACMDVSFEHCGTEAMAADCLNRALPVRKFQFCAGLDKIL